MIEDALRHLRAFTSWGFTDAVMLLGVLLGMVAFLYLVSFVPDLLGYAE